MADNNKNVDAKAAKEAAKAAAKERKERIKRNKPKKDPNAPNIFVRIWKAICKFFKDFRGTVKKVIWPDRKTVLKSTAVVLVTVLLVGICIWVVDWALSNTIELVDRGIETLAEGKDKDVEEEGTTAASPEESTAASSAEEGVTADDGADEQGNE